MKRYLELGIVVSALIAVTACVPASRFEWGAYDQQLFRYHQDAENRDDYIRALERTIERGESTNRVAPGMYAELGYLMWEEGRYEESDSMFTREIQLFPESRIFIERFMSEGAVRQLDAEPSVQVGEDSEVG